ncbi:hypothetical protein L1987_27586 [Smallanthus sonchifolius]|uniref:Uncharacterized protein n=1 Tax=Smallanthus sonchifolius TaxID=185202 RepID=A0ACB9IBX5_9ASTR|nr:hypothetical protein L1987_27586 [Smallanthus sonchifolius]
MLLCWILISCVKLGLLGSCSCCYLFCCVQLCVISSCCYLLAPAVTWYGCLMLCAYFCNQYLPDSQNSGPFFTIELDVIFNPGLGYINDNRIGLEVNSIILVAFIG